MSGGDYDFGTGLMIDPERYVVIHEGKEMSLPKKEFELLSLLASQPGRVFSRENILASVWGTDVVVGDRTIDVHIRKLRENSESTTSRRSKASAINSSADGRSKSAICGHPNRHSCGASTMLAVGLAQRTSGIQGQWWLPC